MSQETKRRNATIVSLMFGTILSLTAFAVSMNYYSHGNEQLGQNWMVVFTFGILVYAFSLATLFDLNNKQK